jgi:sigma-B regulation protein RsbU (phosphoserine phosphatase)
MDGKVELCNAGHLPVLLVRGSKIQSMEATGLPLGMFCSEKFTIDRIRLNHGDRLVLFTDGIFEAQDRRGAELGIQPLMEAAKARPAASARETVRSIMAQAAEFRSGVPGRDDQTVMVIERTESR